MCGPIRNRQRIQSPKFLWRSTRFEFIRSMTLPVLCICILGINLTVQWPSSHQMTEFATYELSSLVVRVIRRDEFTTSVEPPPSDSRLLEQRLRNPPGFGNVNSTTMDPFRLWQMASMTRMPSAMAGGRTIHFASEWHYLFLLWFDVYVFDRRIESGATLLFFFPSFFLGLVVLWVEFWFGSVFSLSIVWWHQPLESPHTHTHHDTHTTQMFAHEISNLEFLFSVQNRQGLSSWSSINLTFFFCFRSFVHFFWLLDEIERVIWTQHFRFVAMAHVCRDGDDDDDVEEGN